MWIKNCFHFIYDYYRTPTAVSIECTLFYFILTFRSEVTFFFFLISNVEEKSRKLRFKLELRLMK